MSYRNGNSPSKSAMAQKPLLQRKQLGVRLSSSSSMKNFCPCCSAWLECHFNLCTFQFGIWPH